jgi:hypothetical protein
MMKIASIALSTCFILTACGVEIESTSTPGPEPAPMEVAQAPEAPPATHPSLDIPPQELTRVIRQNCVTCHNNVDRKGELSLQFFNVALAANQAETAEKMIRKLRAGMMPPPGNPRPDDATLAALVETLEARVDEAAAADPNPGRRTFQRLNQAEYESSIRDLLDLDINAGDYLPLDTKSANFDNIADVQMLSSTLLDAYLNAAAEISRLAVGDPRVAPASKTYTNSGYVTQWDRIEGAPRGTRGGISVVHNFPADGEYIIQMAFDHTTTGGVFGGTARDEQLEISIDGERATLLEFDRWMHTSDPNGVNMEAEPIFVTAGPHRIAAAFLRQTEGPFEDLLSSHEWSLVDRQIGVSGYGVTAVAHMKDMAIKGPFDVRGISETPSRRKIFTCRPNSPEEERACAEAIVGRLGRRAYRRPLTEAELSTLLGFHEEAAAEGGFERGIQTALHAILASPDFYFRIEETPADVKPGENYRIGDFALASRLSFFLWGAPPDDELIALAEEGKLSDPETLDRQTRRMLADSRARALGPRFAGQWLRLEDLDKVHPDRLLFPDFYEQLATDMRRETESLFHHLLREDGSALDLFNADYTYINERLARHYGIPDVAGDRFRRVSYPDDRRRGVLGHGSILTMTSHAGRTSPVNRGKWVMEVLLGLPPPPPPPGIPDLDEVAEVKDGRTLTTRERMEAHREDPTCRACHIYMDPIGLALDNFDVTGRWRIRENDSPLDTRGELYDGTPVSNPEELRRALMDRPTPLIRNFIENLMTYALGRRIEHYDQPTIRAIARRAETDDYRMSSFILGVVRSDAFQMKKATEAAEEETPADRRP